MLKNKGFPLEIIKIADNSASDSDYDPKIEAPFLTKHEKKLESSKISEETTSIQEEKAQKFHDFSAQRIIEQCFNHKSNEKSLTNKKTKEKKPAKTKEKPSRLKEKLNKIEEKNSVDLEIIEINDEIKPMRRKKRVENYRILDNGLTLFPKKAKKRKLKQDKNVLNEEENKKKFLKVQEDKKLVIFPAKTEKIKKKNLFSRTVFLNNENLLIEKKKTLVANKEKNTKTKQKEQKNHIINAIISKKGNNLEENKEKPVKKTQEPKEKAAKNLKNLRKSSRISSLGKNFQSAKRSKSSSNPRKNSKKTNKSNISRNKSVNTIETPQKEEANFLDISARNLKLTDSLVFDVEKKEKKQKNTKSPPIIIPDNSSEER